MTARLERVCELYGITIHKLPGVIAIADDAITLWTLAQHGFGVPDLLSSYDWPHDARPRPDGRPWTDSEEQRNVTRFMVANNRGFVLSDPRTGKTISTLWAIDYLLHGPMAGKRALVIAPKSTHYDTWLKEIVTHFGIDRLDAVVLPFDSIPKRAAAIRNATEHVLITHPETLTAGAAIVKNQKTRRNELVTRAGSPAEALFNRDDIGLVVVDEATTFKIAHSKKSWLFKKFIFGKPYVWALTGTPTGESPMDAHYLAKLFRLDYTGTAADFREETMYKISQFQWSPRMGAEVKCAAVMVPNIRYSYGDVFEADLQTISKEKCWLSPAAREAIRAFARDKKLEVEKGKEIKGLNEGVARLKFLQMASGGVYTGEGSDRAATVFPGSTGKLEAVKRIVQGSHKTLVFVPFTFVATELLVPYLNKEHVSYEYITADQSPKARAEAFDRFRTQGWTKALIADPRLMAHGLDLSCANYIVWFGPCDKGETFTQANRRVVKPAARTKVICLYSTALENRAYGRLIDKKDFQGLVLEEIEKARDENYDPSTDE